MLLDSADREKISFSTHNGHFNYIRTCFGVKNAPKAFQAMVAKILRDIPNLKVYIDDILIYTKDIKTHFQLLFQKLREAKLKLQIKKCSFLKK